MNKKNYKSFSSLILNFKLGLFIFLFLPLLDTIIYLIQQSLITEMLNTLSISLENSLFKCFCYLIMLSGIYEVFRNIKSFYISSFVANLKRALDINLISQILDYEEIFFNKFGSAMILTAVRNITDGIEDACYYLKNILTSIFFLLGTLYYLNFIAPILAYITVLWILIWLIISNFILKVTYKYAVKSAEYKRMFSLNLGDIFNNMFTIKSFDTDKEEKIRNKDLANRVYEMYQKGNIVDLLLDFISTFLYIIFFGYYLYCIHNLWRSNLIKIGEITLIIRFVNDIYDNLDNFNDNLAEFVGMIGQVNDGLKIINQGKVAKIINNTNILDVKTGSMRIKDLKYKYEDQENYQLWIEGELNIKAGSTVALVGTSGGGKTTFFKILLGLLYPNEGEVIIDDQDALKCSIQSLRAAFALVPQDIGLFHRSVYDNIKYGSDEAIIEDVEKVVARTNLTEVINSLERGLDSVIGENTEFSGGQKQRIILARGLLRKAKIFLFDESTSALDAKNENEILESIDDVTKGYTKFIIAHRVKTVEKADLILVFDKGKIIEKGTHKELLNKKGLYLELLNLL